MFCGEFSIQCILTEPIPYTSVYGITKRALASSFRRFTDTDVCGTGSAKYGLLATKYPWIYGYFLQCIGAVPFETTTSRRLFQLVTLNDRLDAISRSPTPPAAVADSQRGATPGVCPVVARGRRRRAGAVARRLGDGVQEVGAHSRRPRPRHDGRRRRPARPLHVRPSAAGGRVCRRSAAAASVHRRRVTPERRRVDVRARDARTPAEYVPEPGAEFVVHPAVDDRVVAAVAHRQPVAGDPHRLNVAKPASIIIIIVYFDQK